jgi:hypothetical protein
MRKGDWGILHVVPNAEGQCSAERR